MWKNEALCQNVTTMLQQHRVAEILFKKIGVENYIGPVRVSTTNDSAKLRHRIHLTKQNPNVPIVKLTQKTFFGTLFCLWSLKSNIGKASLIKFIIWLSCFKIEFRTQTREVQATWINSKLLKLIGPPFSMHSSQKKAVCFRSCFCARLDFDYTIFYKAGNAKISYSTTHQSATYETAPLKKETRQTCLARLTFQVTYFCLVGVLGVQLILNQNL